MPKYVCVICERTVEKPKGLYYCKVCGPASFVLEEGVENVYDVKLSERDLRYIIYALDFLSSKHSELAEKLKPTYNKLIALIVKR